MELASTADRLMAPGAKGAVMPTYLAVAVGGAVGAVSRVVVDRVIEAREDGLFPWSTFVINLSGCFVVGVVIASVVDRHQTPAWLRIGLVMGLLGAYTTFSTFGQETLGLIEEGRPAMAIVYAAGSMAFGVAAVFVGLRVGRML
jgi:CrcB protein